MSGARELSTDPRSFERSSSATRRASTPSRMICGRMKMMSSVRCVELFWCRERVAEPVKLVEDREAGAIALLTLADQPGEQHRLAARDRDRALDLALRHGRRQRVGTEGRRRC